MDAQAAPTTVDQQMREMLDHHQIQQVLVRYTRGQDRFDAELTRSCYFEDAIDDHVGMFVGSVDEFIEWSFEQGRMFVSHHHHITNVSCELDGDDAHCETYFLFVGIRPQPPHFLGMGRYIDHFQRRDGEWRIATRVCVSDGRAQLDGLPPAIPPAGASFHPVTHDRTDISYQRPVRPRPVAT